MLVGVYRGIIIPGSLKWCRIASIHSMGLGQVGALIMTHLRVEGPLSLLALLGWPFGRAVCAVLWCGLMLGIAVSGNYGSLARNYRSKPLLGLGGTSIECGSHTWGSSLLKIIVMLFGDTLLLGSKLSHGLKRN